MTRFIKGCFNKEFIMDLSQLFNCVEDSDCNSGNTEMFGKKITVLQDILQYNEAATQRCQKSCSEKFQKIPKSIVLIFAIKSTPPRVIICEFPRTFQNSCFKEHLRTAVSEIIWGNCRDGFLFHKCSRLEILEQLFRKNSRKLPRKNLCWCAYFNFSYQNTL